MQSTVAYLDGGLVILLSLSLVRRKSFRFSGCLFVLFSEVLGASNGYKLQQSKNGSRARPLLDALSVPLLFFRSTRI